MLRFRYACMLVVVGGIFSSVQVNAQEFAAGNLKLSLNGKGEISGLTVLKDKRKLTSGPGGIVLFDGNTEKEYRSKGVRNLSRKGKQISFEHITDARFLKIGSDIREQNGGMVWTVHLENISQERQLIELRLALPVEIKGKWTYWDGGWKTPGNVPGDIYPEKVRKQEWNGLRAVDKNSSIYPRNAWPVVWKAKGKGVVAGPEALGLQPNVSESFFFPVQTLFDTDKVGLLVGIAPGPYRAYVSGGCQPALGSYDTLYAATKLVLSPGKKDHVSFAVIGYKPTYGHRSSIASYYRMFPEKYRHGPEVNPRYKRNEMQGFISLIHPVPGLREYIRRLDMGWQWTYTPYLHTGRWFPRTTQEINAPWSNMRNRVVGGKYPETIKGYQSYFIDGFRKLQRYICGNFYIILESLDENIARKEYPKSTAISKDGDAFIRVPPSIIGHEKCVMMYASGNKFGKRTLRDIEDIFKVFGVSGIAFDNCSGYQLHWSEDIANEQGAFFIGKRLCTRLGTVHNKIMEKIDSLDIKIDGYAPGIVSNNPGDCWLAWRSEAALTEYSPMSLMYDTRSYHRPEWTEAIRYLMGSKTFILHDGVIPYRRAKFAPKGMNPEEFRARGIRELTMHLLRFGMYPRVCTLTDQMPAEIVATIPIVSAFTTVGGWRPESGLKSDKRLWLERFGDGVNSYVVIINPENDTKSVTIKADPEIFGGYPLFSRFYGKSNFASSVDKNDAVIKADLGPQETLVLKTQALLESRPSATVTLEAEETYSENRLRFVGSPAGAGTALLPLPPDASPASVLVDAKPVAIQSKGHTVRVKLGPTTTAITLRLLREVTDGDSPEALHRFPFMTDGKPSAVLYVADLKDKEIVDIADRLRAYFDYLYLGGNVSQWIASWGGTVVEELPDSYRLAIRSASSVAADAQTARIVIGKDALAKLPDAKSLSAQLPHLPDAGWIILKSDRPTLYIHGKTHRAMDRSMLRVLSILDKKYPDKYFGAEVDYKLAPFPERSIHFPLDALDSGRFYDDKRLNSGVSGRLRESDDADFIVAQFAGKKAFAFKEDKVNYGRFKLARGGLSFLNGGYTIEAWIYPTSKEKRLTVLSGTGGWLHLRKGRLCYRQSGLDKNVVSTLHSVAINAWNHIAVTNDGTTTRLYINGKLCGEKKTGLRIPDITGDYWIGAHMVRSKPLYLFEGGIRDITFSNYQKTEFDLP